MPEPPPPPLPQPADTAPPARPDPWTALRAHTPARIALGRSGVSLPTAELLRFGLAHAQARDAVHLALDAAALAEALRAEGLEVELTHSAAPDRASYLLRPDLGRRLPEDEQRRLQALASRRGLRPRLLVVLGDGLSSLAVARQAPPLLRALRALTPAGWPAPGSAQAPLLLATQARVALGDEIGEALGAGQLLMLIGERPGLSSPDSLGAYLTAAPQRGRHDAQRNCVSNIRPEGLDAERAAHKLWWHVLRADALQATGVALKDLSETLALPGLPRLA